MKTLILAAAATSLVTSAAFAAPIICSTNVNQDPRQATTIVTIDQNFAGSGTKATIVTHGGLAQFVTAPVTFPVETKSIPPEVVEYFNSENGFELTVGFQPINGKNYGTLVETIHGEKYSKPVVCAIAMN